MIRSMTGFGRANGSVDGRAVTVELKSVNSKQFDLSCKTPSRYRELEPEIRENLRKALERGKIELYINSDLPDRSMVFNEETIRNYYDQLKGLAGDLQKDPPADVLSMVMRLPEVTSLSKLELSEEEHALIMKLTKEGTEALEAFRRNEGKRIDEDLRNHVKGISEGLEEVEKLDLGRLERIKERINTKLQDLQSEPNRDRLEQELVYYSEKLDVNEEKVRLLGHCKFFIETMESPQIQKGKKLGFIAQEMGREINTLGSKANDAGIQHLVVQMKENLEKIKEQLLNVL